jgi:acyl carrier protein
MTQSDLLRFLEQALKMKPNSLTGNENLRDVEAWDSMGTLNVITQADRKLGVALAGMEVARCQTVEELITMLGKPRLAA